MAVRMRMSPGELGYLALPTSTYFYLTHVVLAAKEEEKDEEEERRSRSRSS